MNVDAMSARFLEHWPPTKIPHINGDDVRIVKVQGEFTWCEHADANEFFLVPGSSPSRCEIAIVELAVRELFVLPRGVEHGPRGDAETAILLLEPGSVNTGYAGGELAADLEQLA